VAFLGEAARCPDAGTLVDYHADRPDGPPRADVLAGPRYAPVDPRFAEARADREQVAGALVTVGGSREARALAEPAVDALRATFPDARIHVASGAAVRSRAGVHELPFPGSLLDVGPDVDVAVSAAGLTAYELACAGVPCVLVAVAPNQQRVVDGFARARAAIVAGDGDELRAAVERLGDPLLRASLRAAGRRLVDGGGAARTASELDARWREERRGPAARR
jgi:UDP-2,4-diacetamido-2,4,6-trideoxy-beta-L-altropyranose hydrolase